MNKKILWAILLAVAAAVLAFVPGVGGNVLLALALPFTALGWLLRTLSLSGAIGNIAAIVLYAVVCLVPLVFWWKSRRQPEDALLLLLCGVLAFVLYMMVNPGLRPSLLNNEVGDTLYAGTVWSVVITWGVLKLLRSSERILERNIYGALRIFLLICAAECVLDCLGVRISALRGTLEHLQSVGGMFGYNKIPSYLYLILNFAAGVTEGILTALVLYKGAKLMEALEADPYGEACVAASRDVSHWCRQSLMIVSLSCLAENIALILTAGEMVISVSMVVNIPVMGMAISFGMLALTRLLSQGKALKDDNDLFI